MNVILSLFFFLFSLVFTYMSFDYNFITEEGRPDAGFFPIIIGCLLLFFSGYSLIKDLKEKHTPKSEFTHAKDIGFLVISVTCLVLLLNMIGAMLAMALFIFSVLFKFNRKKTLQNILISFGFPTALYLMFDVWLNAGLPKGFLGFM